MGKKLQLKEARCGGGSSGGGGSTHSREEVMPAERKKDIPINFQFHLGSDRNAASAKRLIQSSHAAIMA